MNPAFAYVYADFLTDRANERELGAVETALAQHGIEGRISRWAMFRHPKELIDDLLRVNVKNVIIVGNDDTLKGMVGYVGAAGVTVGFLPMGGPSLLGDFLGLPVGARAVDAIAARLVETFDLGCVNGRYFLTEIVAPTSRARVDIKGQYRVSPSVRGAIAVRNLGGGTVQDPVLADPKDGHLEVVIQAQLGGQGIGRLWKRPELSETRMWIDEGTIIADDPIEVFVDGQPMQGREFAFSIVPRALRMITGRSKMRAQNEGG